MWAVLESKVTKFVLVNGNEIGVFLMFFTNVNLESYYMLLTGNSDVRF